MKKILASILMLTITFCMFGCGNNKQEEVKLQTVEEIVAEIDKQIGNYDEKYLEKTYDSFDGSVYISIKEDSLMDNVYDDMEDRGEAYLLMPVITIGKADDGRPAIIFALAASYFSKEVGMTGLEGLMISDGDNIIDLSYLRSEDDFGSGTICCLFDMTDKDIFEKIKTISNSENNLTIRFKQNNAQLLISDYTLSDEEDQIIKYMFNLYIETVSKVDTKKVNIMAE